MNTIKTILIFAFCGIWISSVYTGCSRKADDYKKYLDNKEITYTGTVTNFRAKPGNLRVRLEWNPSPDPSISRYVVYWNNGNDSLVLPATSSNTSDTIRTLISANLQESNVQNFILYTYDTRGNRSIGQKTPVVKLYGPIYESSLYNRQLNAANPLELAGTDSIRLFFTKTDSSNIFSRLWYYNQQSGKLDSTLFKGDVTTIPLFKPGTKLWIRSFFVPASNAIDTFQVPQPDTLSVTIQMPVPKNLFAVVKNAYDMGNYEDQTGVFRLWNGSVGPQEYPNIYHNSGTSPLPGTISFDMGKLYADLSAIEETGRSCCNNPSKFEVWGIADTTGAFPALPGNDPQWAAQMSAKGWTLLTDAVRTDDGANALKFSFINNPPPIRFIRVRFKATVNNSNYVNLSQLSFWYRL
ncbi:hypothetical protein LQ567_13865 [Niabella pedocola]|uniref:DUF5000 domain-containing protein n=1 Tax=Niabella pedocola TaxID=1752077 RepID=A0ABS8PRZ9_9BACT|nr:DUF4998 domain-containing protein [Niabella pedocola]MCD2423858.1 hypothetical protein [Niabella pedocola]